MMPHSDCRAILLAAADTRSPRDGRSDSGRGWNR
jgi:hypothetical protein